MFEGGKSVAPLLPGADPVEQLSGTLGPLWNGEVGASQPDGSRPSAYVHLFRRELCYISSLPQLNQRLWFL